MQILIAARDIELRVGELGKEISLAYGQTPIVVLGVLKGSLFFLADLLRRVESPLIYELATASSYGDATEPQGSPRIELPRSFRFTDRHVLVVEDIVDTGATLAALHEQVFADRPASLKTCVLLDKPARRQVEVQIDWTGFTVPDRFVVGYGLDRGERYRNLPDVAILDGDD